MRAPSLPIGHAIGQAAPRTAQPAVDNAASQLFVAQLSAATQKNPAPVGPAAAAAPLLAAGGLAAALPRPRRGEARAIASRGLETLEKLQLSMLGAESPAPGELLNLAGEAEAAAEEEGGEMAILCRQLALRLRLEAAKQDPTVA
ncbi:hypothetical protein [Pseudoroseomonas cervicalis]|uniref:hypothetical protein n=1 Tax=Teichococcus cervicalis TaxID=204525 RepID=UPI00278AC54C|nr:hypothetical protein [Pseudoroseomonas cervicalis]MDQ1079543.1 hypothetical protein [Pseudoroseomonas cervicalis]